MGAISPAAVTSPRLRPNPVEEKTTDRYLAPVLPPRIHKTGGKSFRPEKGAGQMCGIQIGAEELESILVNRGPDVSVDEAAACGVQIGAPEVSRVLANRRAAQLEDAACGIQIGAPENVALRRDAGPTV